MSGDQERAVGDPAGSSANSDRFVASLIRASASGLAGLTAEEVGAQNPQLIDHPAIGGLSGLQAKLETRLTYLAAALTHARVEMFADSIHWTRIAWEARGVPSEFLAGALQILGNTVGSRLPAEADRAVQLLQKAAAMGQSEAEIPSHICMEAPHGRLAAEYFLNLLEGNRRGAIDLVLAAVDSGEVDVKTAYLDVILPVLREVGRGWLVGEVSIGEEHFSTATTEALLARLQDRALPVPPKDLVIVGAALENNEHDLGLRMVTDFFEMEGWRAVFLGGGMPISDLAQALIDFRADLLALTVALAPQLETAAALIRFLKQHDETRHIPILVGGAAFGSSPDLHLSIGADGLAEDPVQAVKLGTELTSR